MQWHRLSLSLFFFFFFFSLLPLPLSRSLACCAALHPTSWIRDRSSNLTAKCNVQVSFTRSVASSLSWLTSFQSLSPSVFRPVCSPRAVPR
ncbi:hypothetical protein V8C42DRAFT_310681 [Trichoderma barbatum]